MAFQVPLNGVRAFGHEQRYVAEAMASGQICADGPFTQRCVELLEARMPASRVLLTGSCTAALEIAALLLDLQPGDEVLVPSFTYVSTAAAFSLHGARPVFVDLNPATLGLDLDDLARKLSPRTRAVVCVHYGGSASELDQLQELCERHDLPLIEDNAHGLLGSHRGQALGSFGALSTVSFHGTKSVACGMGGALFINDPRYLERARMIRHKGTDLARFLDGQVDSYTWRDQGTNAALSDLQAAFLCGQLECRDAIHAHRKHCWHSYQGALGNWAQRTQVQLPQLPANGESAYLLYPLVLPDPQQRTALLAFLAARGVQAAFHYQPLHLSRMGRSFGAQPGDCPVSERIAATLLRLPLHNQLRDRDLQLVLEAVQAFEPSASPQP